MAYACPKCTSQNIVIHELFEIKSSMYFEAGKLIDTQGETGCSSLNKFRANCSDCGAEWAPRYKTGHAAREAAWIFERDD